jgi:tetratricopeptide (TPR) repeat protein
VGEFDEGRRLLPAGGNQFQVHFNRARDKLTQILKFFPYNQRARLLGLRIDQVGAPDKFKDKLDTLFREAVARARVNPTEAYADLKDIQAILPTYPGLERALYDVEVALGIRLPPPDPAKLAEARRLYDVANTIFRQRRVADYPTAIDYVNQAIVLNPDFREAIVLKDNLQVAGGAPSTILTSDDQRRLKQAEEEFLKGNYVIAGLIVDDLLKKPQYRNLQQLLELKQRIQSRL